MFFFGRSSTRPMTRAEEEVVRRKVQELRNKMEHGLTKEEQITFFSYMDMLNEAEVNKKVFIAHLGWCFVFGLVLFLRLVL